MANSTTAPVWGPQLPRLGRSRQREWFTQRVGGAGQSRNGVTLEENPWVVQPDGAFKNFARCKDEYRNPQFEPFRQPNFYDDGGPLAIQKSYWLPSNEGTGTITPWKSNTRVKYGFEVVRVAANHDGFLVSDELALPSMDLDVSAYGPLAFAKAKPTNPIASLGVFIAELKDIGGLLIKKITDIKSIADAYLAIQFGWKPLLADINSWIKSIVELDKQFQFLIRNNGKPVRRRVNLLDESTSGQLYFTGNIGITRNTYVDWPGRSARVSSWGLRVLFEKQTKVWASGEFMFFLGDVTLPGTESRIKGRLLGLKVSPSVVWEAVPWSWLVDWLTNAGDVINALDEQVADRTLARYLYVMKHTTRKYTWTGTDGWYRCTLDRIIDTKVREAAHPYGLSFGADLSAKQMSILGAIGAQRF
jgi:hypothetical protein